MVTDLDDLLARCRVAAERKLCRQDVVTELGLPLPSEASNAQIAELKPVYLNFLKELRKNGLDDSIYFEPLRSSTRTEPDAAAVLLYFVEFPFVIRTCRGDISGLAGCGNTEAFQEEDLCYEISKSAVTKWCRQAISEQNNHHSIVLASCINLLRSIQGRKNIKKIIFGSEKTPSEAFGQLSIELAAAISRSDASGDATYNAIQLLAHIAQTLYGDDRGGDVMQEQTQNKPAFLAALERHRNSVDPLTYQHFRIMLGAPASKQQLTALQKDIQGPYVRQPNIEVAVCGRAGCNKPASMKCSACKVVSYCCKECQVADWKENHKPVCKSSRRRKASSKATTGDEQKIAAATEAARQRMRPALLLQDQLLAQYPELDYVIVLPTGNQNKGVHLTHTMGKLMFKLFREKAATTPYAVYRMYKFLEGMYSDLAPIIRKQLGDEYGVDPLSEEARNAPQGDISEDDVQKAINGL